MPEFHAIEIDSDDTWDALCAIQPVFGGLRRDANLGSFLVVDYPEKGEARLCTPETVAVHFDHIEPGNLRIKTVRIVA